jgi:hypothetical protein
MQRREKCPGDLNWRVEQPDEGRRENIWCIEQPDERCGRRRSKKFTLFYLILSRDRRERVDKSKRAQLEGEC